MIAMKRVLLIDICKSPYPSVGDSGGRVGGAMGVGGLIGGTVSATVLLRHSEKDAIGEVTAGTNTIY